MTNEGGLEENGEREREVQYGPALKNKKAGQGWTTRNECMLYVDYCTCEGPVI
jgi:hypothetical protein